MYFFLLMLALLGAFFGATSKRSLFDDETAMISSNHAVSSVRKLQSASYETSAMIEKLQVARAKFYDKLKEEYGSHADEIFKTIVNGQEETVGRSLFSDPISWDRFKRKIMMKILQAKMTGSNQKFVWATGGHSAAAGHGNLFNESYTSILMQKIPDLFDAAGMNFEAKPHAMGSTSSGNEIALCIKEVFGQDFDLISWDYGMTTGKAMSKAELFLYRASLSPNRPALVMLNGNRYSSIMQEMRDFGMPSFLMSSSARVEMQFPDTDGKTPEEIDQMPTHVRAFRCGKGVEKGEPSCGDQKYTYDSNPYEPCNKRKYRVSWHPGWKWHALYGNILSLFLIEILDDALQAIKADGSEPKNLFDKLKAQENEEYQRFLSSTLPTKFLDADLAKIEDIPSDVIYKKSNLCHTARLPADIRYQGILTESDIKGGYDNFDTGTALVQARSQLNEKMPVVRDTNLYQLSCTKYKLEIDYQNFFLANSKGDTKLVLPNDAEKDFYHIDEPLHGFVAMCLATCGWHCPKDTITWEQIRAPDGFLTVSLNGVKVQNFTRFSDDCAFLEHADGHKWTPNSKGKIEFQSKTRDGFYARISAFVLW
uniref:Uncharacterized protein n=1 Tax=Entomoneis paludosa TaxID=265537 RepID=A0A7S3DMP1_9STRA|mmetsp:Transcript_21513/g.44870  ORF Transcript_21513/g.44870 Transcript_21513/m.44870 type:complete len:594 (+) Transcript_21513:14-1795(+)